MSTTATTTAAISGAVIATTMQASSYRVKFKKEQFLELVEIAHPTVIYHRGSNHFFAFDGFLVYSQQCRDDDFPFQKVMEAVELSNEVWST